MGRQKKNTSKQERPFFELVRLSLRRNNLNQLVRIMHNLESLSEEAMKSVYRNNKRLRKSCRLDRYGVVASLTIEENLVNKLQLDRIDYQAVLSDITPEEYYLIHTLCWDTCGRWDSLMHYFDAAPQLWSCKDKDYRGDENHFSFLFSEFFGGNIKPHLTVLIPMIKGLLAGNSKTKIFLVSTAEMDYTNFLCGDNPFPWSNQNNFSRQENRNSVRQYLEDNLGKEFGTRVELYHHDKPFFQGQVQSILTYLKNKKVKYILQPKGIFASPLMKPFLGDFVNLYLMMNARNAMDRHADISMKIDPNPVTILHRQQYPDAQYSTLVWPIYRPEEHEKYAQLVHSRKTSGRVMLSILGNNRISRALDSMTEEQKETLATFLNRNVKKWVIIGNEYSLFVSAMGQDRFDKLNQAVEFEILERKFPIDDVFQACDIYFPMPTVAGGGHAAVLALYSGLPFIVESGTDVGQYCTRDKQSDTLEEFYSKTSTLLDLEKDQLLEVAESQVQFLSQYRTADAFAESIHDALDEYHCR